MPFTPWSGSSSGVGLQPYQFYVKNYGAAGNGQIVTDGGITTATNALACTTSTPFANATAGMPIHVGGAGGGTYTPLCTTIASKTDSGHVTLTANATSTVASGIVYFGTDDTAAIQSAVNAAVTYAQANHGYAEVLFDPVMYIIGGAPVIGGATAGNAQITLPIVATTAQKVTLVFKGTLNQSALNHWLQTIPQNSGTVLACARNDGTVDATNGPSCVIGGPFAGYGFNSFTGAVANTWNNLLPVVNGIGVMLPYNGTYGGFDFYGCAEANLPQASVMAAAVPVTGGPVPSMSTPGNITNFGWFGVRMPSALNNANSVIGQLAVEGIVNGIRASEHTVWISLACVYCSHGIVGYVGSATLGNPAFLHPFTAGRTVIDTCLHGLTALGGGDGNVRVAIPLLDCDGIVNDDINDSTNLLLGYVTIRDTSGTLQINGGTGVRITDVLQASGHMASPPAVPATTVAAAKVWRDASVTIHTGAGVTVSAITIDGTATGTTLAASSSLAVSVPSGKTIALTYAGGTPTWDWWLN